MNLIVKNGEGIEETINFKTPEGKPSDMRGVLLRFVVERGPFAREYRIGNGLRFNPATSTLTVNISSQEVASYPAGTTYYSIYAGRERVQSGVIRVM